MEYRPFPTPTTPQDPVNDARSAYYGYRNNQPNATTPTAKAQQVPPLASLK
jgi:hypothetical protein